MEIRGSHRLGLHLKRLREERKLTLGGVESLSANHGERINKAYLFRVERGKILPTLTRLQVLSLVYHVKLTSLVELLDTAVEEEKQQDELGLDLPAKSFQDLLESGAECVQGGQFTKAAAFFRAACERAAAEEPSPARTEHLARARHDLSIALRNAGRWDLARSEAEAVFEEPDLSGRLLDKIRLNLAVIYRRLGQTRLSTEVLDGLVARRGELPLDLLALVHQENGSRLLKTRPREAATHYRSALIIERGRKNRFSICKLLINIGLAELNAGNHNRSLRVLLEAKDLGKRHQFSYLLALSQTLIGRNYWARNDLKATRSTLREANEFARYGDYFDLLLANQYYLWRLALSEGKAEEARIAEASLKFFATRIKEPCEELEAYRKEKS